MMIKIQTASQYLVPGDTNTDSTTITDTWLYKYRQHHNNCYQLISKYKYRQCHSTMYLGILIQTVPQYMVPGVKKTDSITISGTDSTTIPGT